MRRSFVLRAVAAMLPPGARLQLMEEGWVFVPGLLDAKTVQQLVAATVLLEQSVKDLVRDTTVRGVGFEVQSTSGRRGEPAVVPGALRKITSPSKGHPVFERLRKDPRVLEALAGCGLASAHCHVDQVNFKRARVGTPFPFHQDAHFVVGATQGRIERKGGLNLVIALDPADAQNGGFEVLGRTHLNGLQKFPYDPGTTNEGVFDETHRALPPLQPGDAVFFNPLLAHGSGVNRSDRPRRLVTMWFVGD